MKKAFTLIELIFVIVILGIISAVAIPKFQNLRNHAIIEGMSYTLTSGLKHAVGLTFNYIYMEDNSSFKLDDVLEIKDLQLTKGLIWNYTQSGPYNSDGTYSLRDETYADPEVVLRITLDKSEKVIKYRIDCTNLRISTHGDLRVLCIKKWGDEDIRGEVRF